MPIKAWVVEDNPNFRREIVREIDGAADIDCTQEFGNAASFNAILQTLDPLELPDVVLMDIKLENEEEAGIRCTRALKNLYPDVAVVMLTAFDDTEKIYKALEAGADSYLLKEQAFAQTLAAIRQAIHGAMLMPKPVAEKVRRYFGQVKGKNVYALTKREQEVLQEMCEGLTEKEMADKLYISENTISQHVRKIYLKLQVNTRGGAVSKAFRERLVY